MKTSWKALVRKDSMVTLDEVEMGENGYLMVKILAVGICGTDLDILRSARSDKATILGHEGIGEVVWVGSSELGFEVGEKVVFNPVNPNNQQEILGHSKDGLFQEYYMASQQEIESGLLLKLPTTISLTRAIFIEPLATAIYGQGLVDSITEQQHVVVIGAGPIGLLNVLYAKSRGLKVLLVERNRARLDFAVAKGIIKPSEALYDAEDLVDTISKTYPAIDAVYLCANREGALEGLIKAVQYVKEGGCIDLVGGIKDGDSIAVLDCKDLNMIRRSNICGKNSDLPVQLIKSENRKKLYLTGHRGTSHSHLLKAYQLLGQTSSKYHHILTNQIAFSKAAQLLNDIMDINGKKNSTYVKGMITF